MSMGTTPADPAVAEMIARTLRHAAAAGKPCGLAFGAAAPAVAAIGQGCGFAVVSNDTSMLANAACSVVTDVRAGVA
jgi:2-keto-3-deoxy-L-rhamnonate aldolase RhmA